MGSIREILGKWEDREVSEPALVITERKGVQHYFSRTWLSIAASLLILIIAGFATGLNFRLSSDGFELGFNEKGQAGEETFTRGQVDKLLQAYEAKLDERFDSFRGDMNESLEITNTSNEDKIENAYNRLLAVSQQQIAEYVSQMDQQQKQTLENLVSLSQEQQRLYFNNVMSDFTAYLEEQRQADLENIELYLTGFEQSTDQKLMQTDQILASLISQVGAQPLSD